MTNAMRHGLRHPLDVDLADYVSELVDAEHMEALEDHLRECLLCRIKVRRLRDALHGPGQATGSGKSGAGIGVNIDAAFSTSADVIPADDIRPDDLEAGQLWAAGEGDRVLVLIQRKGDGRALVVPVTVDTFATDDEAIIVEAAGSPLNAELAVYPLLASELPTSSLTTYFGQLTAAENVDQLLEGALSGTTRGQRISGPTDPRLEFRQMLADRLGALDEIPADPDIAADAPPLGPEWITSRLAKQLHDRRGGVCKTYRLNSWDELVLAYARGWIPLAIIDEIGLVLVVFDTPTGLISDNDFDAAMSVLTRYNATAVVVLATSLSSIAELFDATSLSYGISVPSGQQSSPTPLISGLELVDAIAKFLEQNSFASGAGTIHASASTSNVIATLARSVTSAIDDVVRQGQRAKIKSKIAGYISVQGLAKELEEVLRGALNGDVVTQHLSDIACRDER